MRSSGGGVLTSTICDPLFLELFSAFGGFLFRLLLRHLLLLLDDLGLLLLRLFLLLCLFLLLLFCDFRD